MNANKRFERGPRCNRHWFGFTLVEVLVSLVILAVGLIVMANFQGRITASSADAKARSEAMQLAQQRMELLRGQDSVESGSLEDIPGRITGYDMTWNLDNAADADMLAATVTVTWTDSRNQTGEVVLLAYIAASAYAGSVNPGSGVAFEGPIVVGPGGGARLKRYDPNDLPQGMEDAFVEGDVFNEVLGKLDPDPDSDGNIEYINLETGEAIEIISPNQAAIFAGSVFVRDNVGRDDAADVRNDVFVLATPISLCVYAGLDDSDSDYDSYQYRCIVSASDPADNDRTTFGWYGNIGIVHPSANNQDGVCVGSSGEGTAVPSSVRQYRGYETRVEACEEVADCLATDADGSPILFPVGVEGAADPPRFFEEHDFLVGRIGNNPLPADCVTQMDVVGASEFLGNPPEFFCFSSDPALCPGRTFGVAGPPGCGPVGSVCSGSGADYDGMVFAGVKDGFYYFTSILDEDSQVWATAVASCTGKTDPSGWFLGNVNEVSEFLHLNRLSFSTPAEGAIAGVDWSQPFSADTGGRFWTATPHGGGSQAWWVDVESGDSGRIRLNEDPEYRSRCLFRVPF